MKKLFTLISLALAFMQGNALDYNNPSGNNYINEWGRLKLVGNQLCSESGNPIQLRGWSTHGSWFKYCYDDKGDFEKMKNQGANMARIAQYVTEGDGVDKNWVKNCIDYTAELGMYCLVDWHVLKPGNPNSGQYSGYEDFFNELTSYVKSKNYKHVLWEICNEPNEDTDGDPHRPEVWGWIKKYAKKALPIIEKNDPQSVVMVGTPQWDQAVSLPVEDPITDTYNLHIMYSFHYYAGDQERYLGLLNSATAFIPLFVTEWGLSSHTGDSGCDTKSGQKLMDVCSGMNLGNQIVSWANWSWSDKGESSGTFTGGGYNNLSFSDAGNFIKNQLKKGDNFQNSDSEAYEVQEVGGVEDFYLALEKFDKGGNYKGYYDFDEDWACDIVHKSAPCSENVGDAGKDGVRSDEAVDLGYTDKNNKADSYINVGYIGMGEWVKYTLDLKYAGDYDFELYTCNHIDTNVVAFTVDGKNALVDQDGNEVYRAVKLQTSGSGVKDGGYDDWGWTKPKSPYSPSSSFRLHFDEAGKHTLGIVFFSSCSGLGSLKLLGDANRPSSAPLTYRDNAISVWPNPSENGAFNVSVSKPSKVEIFDIQKLVYSQNIESETQFNLNLAKGVYIVKITNDNESVTKKLIVK